MSKLKLNYFDQNHAIVCMLSGSSMAALARYSDVSPSTIAAIRTRYPDRFNMFKEVNGVMELTDKTQTLDINGNFVANRIIVTGSPFDGVIMCDEIYEHVKIDPDEVEGPDFDKNEFVDWAVDENEIGLFKTVKCGILIHRQKVVDKVDGSSYAPKDKYSGPKDSKYFRGSVTRPRPEKVKPVPIEAPIKPVELIWNASNRFISITKGREVFNAASDHPEFKAALSLLANDNVEGALMLINKEQAVKRFVQGNVVIEKGQLFYKGMEIKSGLTRRIIDAMDKGKDFKFFLPFLENLMLNPSKQAVDRLFDFLQANDISITKTGYIIAWKKISHDYKDLYTGTKDNRVGKLVEMPRNQVNDNDRVTCSDGLHACSKSYLPHYGGSGSAIRVVKVKIHPRDVVSIPTDYKNAKIRCCQYEVVEEVKAW